MDLNLDLAPLPDSRRLSTLSVDDKYSDISAYILVVDNSSGLGSNKL
jgi:hypothetical protein